MGFALFIGPFNFICIVHGDGLVFTLFKGQPVYFPFTAAVSRGGIVIPVTGGEIYPGIIPGTAVSPDFTCITVDAQAEVSRLLGRVQGICISQFGMFAVICV